MDLWRKNHLTANWPPLLRGKVGGQVAVALSQNRVFQGKVSGLSWFDGGTVSLQLRCKLFTPLCNKNSTMQELFETVPFQTNCRTSAFMANSLLPGSDKIGKYPEHGMPG